MILPWLLEPRNRVRRRLLGPETPRRRLQRLARGKDGQLECGSGQADAESIDRNLPENLTAALTVLQPWGP